MPSTSCTDMPTPAARRRPTLPAGLAPRHRHRRARRKPGGHDHRQVIAGVGFGAAFSASLRLIFPLAAAHQRAGIVAGIYVVAYVAFGLPVVIAGRLAAPFGLVPTDVWYGALTVLLTLISLGAQLRIRRGAQS